MSDLFRVEGGRRGTQPQRRRWHEVLDRVDRGRWWRGNGKGGLLSMIWP